MTVLSEPSETGMRPAQPLRRLDPALLAMAGTLFVTAIGLPSMDGPGIPNSDDLVRLVQVRDLLAGQDWFDLTQYRLGLDGGTPMHWSRLVDAPIAAIAFLGTRIAGDAAFGEWLARVLWPALVQFLALMALMTACGRTANEALRLPVAVVGAVAMWTVGVFAPGSLDHHNIQAALALWLLALLLPGSRPVAAHAAAGLVAVLMLAIGMEVLPYVAVAGAVVSLGYVAGAVSPRAARAFGVSVALTAGAVFLATVAPARWTDDACDGFSSFHLVTGLAGGLGLVAATALPRRLSGRVLSLMLLAAAFLAVVVLLFPHCLANPLASLDPRLREFWLEGVIETRSLADLWREDPFAIPGLYGMAGVALVVALVGAATGRPLPRHQSVVFAAFLAMGLAVTAWQQRGFVFAAVFAVLPLGFWIGRLRASMPEKRGTTDSLRLAGAWAVSLNFLWWIAGAQAANLFSGTPTLHEQAASVSPRDYCYAADLYAPLATEPEGVVLGATDIGAMILLHTNHRAVAGPYHRNTAGNLLLIEAMTAPPAVARGILRAGGVTIVADCMRAADAADFMRAAPGGLQAALRSDAVPDWLEPVRQTVGEPLVLYRVRP
ncbi:GtrA family protein [Oricola thermophila]|uniref:GtrA family protein n=1 Tax=Oricola thermophila TaxID=2742145 RepID=A0A6N1VFR4_9HYPH|nr:GtrA family protein [Oricola thermophila]QKV19776.1 GtrA family protein [Oricola thermophila]